MVLAACSDFQTQPIMGEGQAGTRAYVNVSERVSDDQLKTMYLHCSSAALHQRIGTISVAACSVIYETLLQQVFGGDFLALLRWSREQSHDEAVDYVDRVDRVI